MGQTHPLLWSSPCPVSTSDSNCTAPSRDGRNEGKRRMIPSSRNRGQGCSRLPHFVCTLLLLCSTQTGSPKPVSSSSQPVPHGRLHQPPDPCFPTALGKCISNLRKYKYVSHPLTRFGIVIHVITNICISTCLYIHITCQFISIYVSSSPKLCRLAQMTPDFCPGHPASQGPVRGQRESRLSSPAQENQTAPRGGYSQGHTWITTALESTRHF